MTLSTTRLLLKRTIKAHVLSFGRKQSLPYGRNFRDVEVSSILTSGSTCSDDEIPIFTYDIFYSDDEIPRLTHDRS